MRAQSVTDLTLRAAALRNKIRSDFQTGGVEGAKALAADRATLADTEDQLHAASQSMLARIPAGVQQRIAKAVAPDLDWDDAAQTNAQDPIAHFATENIGSALRGATVAPDLLDRIRKFAIASGLDPDLADHIVNQALGANAVKDLTAVIRGESIGQSSAEVLQHMGLLRQSDPSEPSSPLHVTEDALSLLPSGAQRFAQLRPDVARYIMSPASDRSSALYQNAIGGMQHFAESADAMLPVSSPASDGGGTIEAAANGTAPAGSLAANNTSPDNPGATAGPGSRTEVSGGNSGQTIGGAAGADGNGDANAAASDSQTRGSGLLPVSRDSRALSEAPHPALANTPQQALKDAAAGKKAYTYDPKNGLQFQRETPADGLKQALEDGVVDKAWAAQHLPEFQKVQDKYQALEKAAGSAQVLKALLHGVGPGAAFAAAFPLGAAGGAAAGSTVGGWVGGIAGVPTGPGEAATIPVGAGIGAGIGYVLGGLTAGTLAALAARKGLQALGEYSDAINSLNASAELHPVADATGEMVTLALNPLSAAEKAAGEGFSYTVGAPAAVRSIRNLTALGKVAAKGASEVGANGAVAATKAVGGVLAKGAAAGLVVGVAPSAFHAAALVAASKMGIDVAAPQPPALSSLVLNATLGVLLAGEGITIKEIPAGEVASAMIRGKVREDLGIPLDSADPVHASQIASEMAARGGRIDITNVSQLTAPLSEADQSLYTALSSKIDAMRAAGKFDGKTGDFASAKSVKYPGAPDKSRAIMSGGITIREMPGIGTGATTPEASPGHSPAEAQSAPSQIGSSKTGQLALPEQGRPPQSSSTKKPIDVATVTSNSTQLWDRSADEIAAAFNKEGFKTTTWQSTRGSKNARIVQVVGHPEIGQIQVHAGGGIHSGPYIKISTSTQGIIKVVDPNTYRPTPGEKAKIIPIK